MEKVFVLMKPAYANTTETALPGCFMSEQREIFMFLVI